MKGGSAESLYVTAKYVHCNESLRSHTACHHYSNNNWSWRRLLMMAVVIMTMTVNI